MQHKQEIQPTFMLWTKSRSDRTKKSEDRKLLTSITFCYSIFSNRTIIHLIHRLKIEGTKLPVVELSGGSGAIVEDKPEQYKNQYICSR